MNLLLNPKNIFQNIKIVALALIVVFCIQYASAASWVAPLNAPISPNVAAPINTSNVAQTKTGGLIVADGGGITTGFLVPNGNVGIGPFVGNALPTQKLDASGYIKAANGFCIGTSCITAWPPDTLAGSAGVAGIRADIGTDLEICSANPTISCPPQAAGMHLSGNVIIRNTSISGISAATQVKLFCIANNPPHAAQCPDNAAAGFGWISAGVLDNGGYNWCADSNNGNFIYRSNGDAVLCYR